MAMVKSRVEGCCMDRKNKLNVARNITRAKGSAHALIAITAHPDASGVCHDEGCTSAHDATQKTDFFHRIMQIDHKRFENRHYANDTRVEEHQENDLSRDALLSEKATEVCPRSPLLNRRCGLESQFFVEKQGNQCDNHKKAQAHGHGFPSIAM